MHKGQAIAKAQRLYAKGCVDDLYISPCGCGRWVVKTKRACELGGYLDGAILVARADMTKPA